MNSVAHVLNGLLTIGAVVPAVIVIFAIARNWIKDSKDPAWKVMSWWQRFLSVSRDSASWLWANVMIISGGILSFLTWLANALGDPTVSTLLQQYYDAKVVGAVLVGAALVSMWARARTL